jgi:hypothetical protein
MWRAIALIMLTLVAFAGIRPSAAQEAGAPSEEGTRLASSALRRAVEQLERGNGAAAGTGVQVLGGSVRVEVLHNMGEENITALVERLGGSVDDGVLPGLVQALVPYDRLLELQQRSGVSFVRPPGRSALPGDPRGAPLPAGAIGPVTGQHVEKTNAAAWHGAGFSGAGAKIGLIDFFDGFAWAAAQEDGEVPPVSGTFCRIAGTPCDAFDFILDQHGNGVAEVVHDMAPDADIYIATVYTVSDLQAAVDYFAARGVDIISRSLTSEYDGPGDGTGPTADVIEDAVSKGMVWFNSAGNASTNGSFPGQYWRGPWTDSNGNGFLEFAPGDERLALNCNFANGVRWDDFGSPDPTDYDVYVYDEPGDALPFFTSTDDQVAGAPPVEMFIPCNPFDFDYLAIRLRATGDGASGDTLEFMVNQGGLEYSQNAYSASGPASDTASAGALSVGAIDPALGTTIAKYSSQGPSNDERTKPDISAAACLRTAVFGLYCFNGTSAASPVAAGAAALVIESGLATSPADIKSYLLDQATVDRGDAGPDNVYGRGELVLPAPPPLPTPGAPTPIPTPVKLMGDVDCDGDADTIDAALILQRLAYLTPGLLCKDEGDVNNDGRVDAIDASLVLQYAAGLLDTLPP